jgi:hypothetical protein
MQTCRQQLRQRNWYNKILQVFNIHILIEQKGVGLPWKQVTIYLKQWK